MKILVIDDSPDLLAQVCQALQRERYQVETAEDGEAALDKLFSDSFDLVLLDIMLPKRDGLAVLYELRAADINTPVLLLTARGEVEDRITGLDKGADDYLAKPFSMAELMARIRALLRRAGSQSQPLLQADTVTLDSITRVVKNGDKKVELTPKDKAA